MANIKKIGHVVLGSRDPKRSMEWYRDALGMDVVHYLDRAQMWFLSFGTQHHDLAVTKLPDDAPVGTFGASHVAIEIEGGLDQLKELYERVKEAGGEVENGHDFGMLTGFYCLDPDGNRLELYFDHETHEEAKAIMREGRDGMRPVDLETAGVRQHANGPSDRGT